MPLQGIDTEHGHLFANTSITVDIVTQNVAVAIGHATAITSGKKRHVAHTIATGRQIVGVGRYRVGYKVRHSTAKASKVVILKNGVAESGGFDVLAAAGLLVGEAVVEVTAADTYLQIGIMNTEDTADITVTFFDFVVEGLESTSPRQPPSS